MKNSKKRLYELYEQFYYPLLDENILRKNDYDIVYLVHNKITNLYKIGITKNWNERIRTIECATGCEIDLVILLELECNFDEKAIIIEKFIHNYYRDLRQRGEWFKLSNFNIREIKYFFHQNGAEVFDSMIQQYLDLNLNKV